MQLTMAHQYTTHIEIHNYIINLLGGFRIEVFNSRWKEAVDKSLVSLKRS